MKSLEHPNEQPIPLDMSGEAQRGNFIQQELAADPETNEVHECPRCGKSMVKVAHEGSVDEWHCPVHGIAINQDGPH